MKHRPQVDIRQGCDTGRQAADITISSDDGRGVSLGKRSTNLNLVFQNLSIRFDFEDN